MFLLSSPYGALHYLVGKAIVFCQTIAALMDVDSLQEHVYILGFIYRALTKMQISNPIRCQATPHRHRACFKNHTLVTGWIVCFILLPNNLPTNISISNLKYGFIYPQYLFPLRWSPAEERFDTRNTPTFIR
ncbi:hypothetical protein AVEN_763-1 [Araneus ventricosus]|uniref:Uncharacterized protein n=1 Tax=Araneus ventricosus TaxID=182803 RepID=A0A4Y2B9K0_ARAVE|nr:hypothetical protein AVEN_763-1 [Araneus ventricosus]